MFYVYTHTCGSEKWTMGSCLNSAFLGSNQPPRSTKDALPEGLMVTSSPGLVVSLHGFPLTSKLPDSFAKSLDNFKEQRLFVRKRTQHYPAGEINSNHFWEERTFYESGSAMKIAASLPSFSSFSINPFLTKEAFPTLSRDRWASSIKVFRLHLAEIIASLAPSVMWNRRWPP